MKLPECTLTVVLTRYNESDEMVLECLQTLIVQNAPSYSVVFYDQSPSEKVRIFCEEKSSVNKWIMYQRIPKKSLSYARNLGLKNANSPYVAFCDVDCILPENWIEEIIKTFEKTNASIVGTKIMPKWIGIPKWFHRSSTIKEFYSLIDLSPNVMEVPKVVGASFAVDKWTLGENGYFDENLGRKKGKYFGGEETDLCKRVREAGGKIVYTPTTFAYHQVPKERMNSQWILKRAYYGGYSRAMRGGSVEPFNKKHALLDRLCIMMILPSYAAGFFKGKSQEGVHE